MPDLRLLVFDWDGTLMDSSDRIAECFASAAVDNGIAPPGSDAVKHYIGLNLAEAWSRLYPSLDGTTIAALVASYREHWLFHNRTPMPLFEGVAAGLAQLHRHGYLLSVATGKSRAGLDRALSACELGAYFACTRCADESRAKPHPQMLLDILDFTGTESADALMIGDTTYDLEMAAGAKVSAAGVGYGSHAPDLLQPFSHFPVAGHFSELVAMLLDG